jgi:hypothetical protein
MPSRSGHINRRGVVQLVSTLAWMVAVRTGAHGAYYGEPLVTTADIPLELAGNWRESTATDASAVIARMREACLSDLQLHSDRQPERLRVDDHTSGSPAIWLHSDPATTAWIIVDVGTRDWCNLAYQFGHELGHVVANSWARDAKPGGSCQWLEEALVEAFSFRGLGRLADSWRARPPFPNDNAYADAILEYRDRTLQPDWKLAQDQRTAAGLRDWFSAHREYLETHGSVDTARPAVPTILALYEGDVFLVEDLGAMNRWPERTNIDLNQYLERWQASCAEIGTSGHLPQRLQELLA